MKVVGSKNVYSGFMKLNVLDVETESGKIIHREVLERGDAVAGLIYNTKTQKYIFVKQFRPGAKGNLVEIVAGTMDVEGETPEHCMVREVMEEVGYKVDKIEQLNSCYCSPGSMTEKLNIFYIEVSEKVEEGGGVGDESLELVEVVETGLSEHFVNDAKTIIAIQWLRLKQMQKLLMKDTALDS
jgi:ADP-ribose pyrophosphatase